MTEQLNGRAVTAVCLGITLVWSGVKGWSLLGTLGDLIQGRKPSQTNNQPLAVSAPGEGTLTTASVGGIAETALQYQGHAYLFGGAPGPDGSRPWDCSSFVNFIIAIKFGQSIPGYSPGKYDGNSHGPTTGQWAVWNGLQHIGRTEVQASDIIVWPGHMGIAISNTQFVSALNPTAKTAVRNIDGGARGAAVYGRYVGV